MTEYQARPHDELIRELLDPRIPKSEREHAAAREIEALRERIKRDEALLLQALDAIEKGAWDTLRGRNAAAAIRERLGV